MRPAKAGHSNVSFLEPISPVSFISLARTLWLSFFNQRDVNFPPATPSQLRRQSLNHSVSPHAVSRHEPPPSTRFFALCLEFSQNLPKDALSNGVGLDQQPLAAASAPSAAVTTVAAAPRRFSSEDQGNQASGGGGSRAAHGGIASSGDGGRPSPVRVTRVFGGGLQVRVWEGAVAALVYVLFSSPICFWRVSSVRCTQR